MCLFHHLLAMALSFFLLLALLPQENSAAPAKTLQEEYADLSDSDLDALVAQVLGAATYPDQVVEANHYLQANPTLKGDAFQRAVEQTSRDPAVQALTQFPSVLDNLARQRRHVVHRQPG